MNEKILDEYFNNYALVNCREVIETVKNDYIAFEKYQTSFVYVAKSGILKMSTILSDGNEFNIKLVGAGNIVTLLEDEVSPVVDMPFTIKTLSREAEIILLDRVSFWEDIKKDSILNEYIRSYYRKNLHYQIRKTCALASNGKYGAVCSQLFELQLLFGKDTDKGRMIDLSISNEELAKFCGMSTASSFNRILRKLKDQGIIQTIDNRIVINDADLLKPFFT
ncbi:Crp/Fnr family transcriptional regulator [Vagococcus vulneris]|uniref:HTH crp-type domain-containing protein n=1 Tax=Vagococcus vulneris TaxID=1977869 RepID=A0A430A109_9ENTE|nr:Crp/Fnr family transcriptional regulator [Vagococcus vulneris]RSU00095.1 hypothetical protein CBF37_01995 [Vagococcus vulneris]